MLSYRVMSRFLRSLKNSFKNFFMWFIFGFYCILLRVLSMIQKVEDFWEVHNLYAMVFHPWYQHSKWLKHHPSFHHQQHRIFTGHVLIQTKMLLFLTTFYWKAGPFACKNSTWQNCESLWLRLSISAQVHFKFKLVLNNVTIFPKFVSSRKLPDFLEHYW